MSKAFPIQPEFRPFALSVWRGNFRYKDLALVTFGVILMAVSAQIAIPFKPVPFTMQTFGLMLCSLSLGRTRGFWAALAYVGVGAIGVPVFSAASGGFHVLTGPTAGYLLTYPFVAFFLGWWADKGWDRSWRTLSVAILLAEVIVFVGGVSVLQRFVGWHSAFLLGVMPFVWVELAKVALLAGLLPAMWHFKTKEDSGPK